MNNPIQPTGQPKQPASDQIRTLTPARIFVGPASTSYQTATQLRLRQDHAAARDAVQNEVDLKRDLGDLITRFHIFEVNSVASSKSDFLMKPNLGRRLSEPALETIRTRCPSNCDIQVVIGDGLSAAAVAAQVPKLLPLLHREAEERKWTFGCPFFIRYCRVGIMNDVGMLLQPTVVLLLIGERPGLATAESLSVYMAYRPTEGHTDANRNLISNIHDSGVDPVEAAKRVCDLAEIMRHQQLSGTEVKEMLPSADPKRISTD